MGGTKPCGNPLKEDANDGKDTTRLRERARVERTGLREGLGRRFSPRGKAWRLPDKTEGL